jgi:hypothetical protein
MANNLAETLEVIGELFQKVYNVKVEKVQTDDSHKREFKLTSECTGVFAEGKETLITCGTFTLFEESTETITIICKIDDSVQGVKNKVRYSEFVVNTIKGTFKEFDDTCSHANDKNKDWDVNMAKRTFTLMVYATFQTIDPVLQHMTTSVPIPHFTYGFLEESKQKEQQ